MKKTKRLLAAVLALVLALSILAGCGGGGATTSPDGGNSDPAASAAPPADGGDTGGTGGANANRTLNIAAGQDSGTLDPLAVTGGFVSIMYAFYEPLFDTKADGTRVWLLATSLEPVSDIEYTLTIREGVKFSNGNPLTAEDVMFTMEQCAANPQFALNVKVVDFEKTKVTGDYTIDLWYTEFNASQEPGFASMLIQDKESYDGADFSRNTIGTGAYVATDYVVNSHLNVTARDDYWGVQPAIKNISFKVINEPSQVINALETGEVDMSTIAISDVDYVESLGYDVTVNKAGYNNVILFSMLPGTPLESKEARYAVSHAIDRQSITDILYDGESTVTDYAASHGLVDFEDRFLNIHDTYSIGYNPDKAKELATQSGLVGKTVRIITNGASDAVTTAEMIQANLLDIGIDAKIANYDQATYFGTIMDASNFEIAVFAPSSPSYLAVDILAMYLTFIPLGWTDPDRDLYGEISQGAITTADDKARADKLYDTIVMFEDFEPWYSLNEVVMARAQSPDLTGVEYMLPGSIYYNNIAFK
ncbi:MAG: ABC transporter substrate-binding protein [Oscillospiraceae bacterium]|jgi:peptide/nickel transport system substrate-binding protein|nr:ABC transporter substrate-binding protein [Oscillospiraceae bacterium]